MSENAVSESTCKACKDGINGQIKNIDKKVDENARVTEKRLDAHADSLEELKGISTKLTTLLEQQTEKKEKQEERSYDKKAKIFYPIIASTCSTLFGFILGFLIK